MNDNNTTPFSGKKMLAILIVIIIVIAGFWILIKLTTLSDPPWIFSQPEMTVNKTTSNNITTETVISFNHWADNYHDKYHIDKVLVTITTSVVHNETFLFTLDTSYRAVLDESQDENIPVPNTISQIFNDNSIQLHDNAFIQYAGASNVKWMIRDNYPDGKTYQIKDNGNVLEVHKPELEYGDYSHHDKLSTIMGEHNYPISFYDVDGDSYLSVGDYFVTDPSIIAGEQFDYLGFNVMLQFGDNKESILRLE